MSINFHPQRGSILMCDFDQGFKTPEMVKTRPVLVISPPIKLRPNLCTIVALSTTKPEPVMGYHIEITLKTPLPAPFKSTVWVKGDMVNAVGFHRLNLIRTGRVKGQRQYYFDVLEKDQLNQVEICILNALNLNYLTKFIK